MKNLSQFPGILHDIEYHLPNKILKNNYFQEKFPHWKVEQTATKTGVYERHIATSNETAYDLALIASKKLFEKYPKLAVKIDAIIFCTQTPDYIMPSNAFLLQQELGLRQNILAFDFNLGCSGYIYGLLIASGFIKTNITKNILLITADTYSKLLHENDRATQLLFGDGASASWIGEDIEFGINPLISVFEDFICATDGKGWDKFIIRSGGMRQPLSSDFDNYHNSKIYMNGLQVVNFVNHKVGNQICDLLTKHNINSSQIDQFFVHQASKIALESLCKKLKIDSNKMYSNISTIGNTVSSSLPILIKDYFSHSSLKKNSRLILCGFGVGFSWGSLLARK